MSGILFFIFASCHPLIDWNQPYQRVCFTHVYLNTSFYKRNMKYIKENNQLTIFKVHYSNRYLSVTVQIKHIMYLKCCDEFCFCSWHRFVFVVFYRLLVCFFYFLFFVFVLLACLCVWVFFLLFCFVYLFFSFCFVLEVVLKFNI